jgi:hypothetical protein
MPPPVHHMLPFVPPSPYPGLQGSSLVSAHARPSSPVYDSNVPVSPTPLSPTYLTTPGSSGVSTSSSPDRSSVSIPSSSSRRKRLQSRTPNVPPQSKRSTLRSAEETKDGVALDNVRKYVRKFVKEHPVSIEPSIGDPAMGSISLNSKFGAPGKSLYSAFFSTKPPFTCYECGCVERRYSRAVRHQRQEHFMHFPFACPGGRGHPAW